MTADRLATARGLGFTTSVDSSGDLAFRNDLYGHDKRLMAALNGAEPLFAEELIEPDLTGDISEIDVLPRKRKKTRIVVNDDEPSIIVGKKKKRRSDEQPTKR